MIFASDYYDLLLSLSSTTTFVNPWWYWQPLSCYLRLHQNRYIVRVTEVPALILIYRGLSILFIQILYAISIIWTLRVRLFLRVRVFLSPARYCTDLHLRLYTCAYQKPTIDTIMTTWNTLKSSLYSFYKDPILLNNEQHLVRIVHAHSSTYSTKSKVFARGVIPPNTHSIQQLITQQRIIL